MKIEIEEIVPWFAVPLLAASCAAQNETAKTRFGAEAPKRELAEGWLSWRGPLQTGASLETGLVEEITLGGEGHLWSYAVHGRGTPVVSNGRVFTMAYEGEGKELQELILCLDEKTGERLWQHGFSDFLSDVIYDRYAIASPTVDPETGNVYFMTSAGLFCCFSADGDELWQVSLVEELGRMTFPNGRTGSPVVDGDLVIVHVVTSHWGADGPARDRFHAFDKDSGVHVWGATPGTEPKDNPYSFPVLAWKDGRRVLYSGTGCGNVVCLDSRTGDTLWRYPVATGGVNASVVLHGDELIAIHARENFDTSTIGRMWKMPTGYRAGEGEQSPVVLASECELWRQPLASFTSSPTLVGERVYQTVDTGDLCCLDADSGDVLWHAKLAPDQIHASPLAADGKLYVPMNNGTFYVIRPSDEGPEILCELQLEGNCLGAPSVCNGRIYVHTTERLYCFGTGEGEYVGPVDRPRRPEPGNAARLQILPGDVLLHVGDELAPVARTLDANGWPVAHDEDVAWEAPPLLEPAQEGGFRARAPGVGMLKAKAGPLAATSRLRVVRSLPYTSDFEGFALDQGGGKFAYPPGEWLGARVKWQVIEREGNKVLARVIDNPLFQRTITLIGHPGDSNYTMQVDILTDGNRRSMCSAGVVNQRYAILLKGNHQQLEVTSSVYRLQESVPYAWKAGEWYTMKTRVEVAPAAPDGASAGVVRAKVWPTGEPEPEAWTIEVEHGHAQRNGAPGLLGFTPQSRFRVYLDNLSVTPNE